MKTIKFPERSTWTALCQRPIFNSEDLTSTIQAVLQNVRSNGDAALFDYTEKWDNVALDTLEVSKKEWTQGLLETPDELVTAMEYAYERLRLFHGPQWQYATKITTEKGVECWRKSIAIESVGLYIPGGSAPLFSTVLMLGVPAQIADCPHRILCTPPDKNGQIHPAILWAARKVGITQIFKVGGAQAIAAMAYGTASIPKVDKIFGPGNQYVTKAKELVQMSAGIAIDMPAGPSEVLVIADETAHPNFVAADLLAQAEHGPDSQVVLLTTDAVLLEATLAALQQQLAVLPRKNIAAQALANSYALLLPNLSDCMEFSNQYAPEHLILALDQADLWAEQVRQAGSVFLGHWSCESAGDYVSGTNHALPTNGFARAYSGVSVDSFVKKVTFQQLSFEGLRQMGSAIETMAAAESLQAHKNAVTIRLQTQGKVNI